MTGVDLAVGSFGQRFTVTPIQMITAFAATINGGKLLQPYVVQTVTAADGTVVENTEPTVVRQVVSQETSDKCREILTSVVMAEKGTGKNARQAGYTIGGKTGTSETTVPGEVVVSFMVRPRPTTPRSWSCWPTTPQPGPRRGAASAPPAPGSAAATWVPPWRAS